MQTCQHIWTKDTFKCTTTGCSYHIQATATCKTRNIIYLIECKLQYVGTATISTTRGSIKKPVAIHFNTLSHTTDNHSVMVIKKMKSADPDLRKKGESY